MSFDYSKPALTADRLLKRFGTLALLRRGAVAVYDPNTGGPSASTSVDEPITACCFDYEEKVIDGSLIQRGDKQAFVSVFAPATGDKLLEPRAGDAFIWLNETYTIVRHKELSPAGTNVLFEYQVRK